MTDCGIKWVSGKAADRSTAPQCYSCHTADFNNSKNPPHVQLGLPRECGSCHTTVDWSNAKFELKLVNASAGDARPHTVKQWALGAGASAGINAGMFREDGLTSVGLMKTRLHENNPRRVKSYKASPAIARTSGRRRRSAGARRW